MSKTLASSLILVMLTGSAAIARPAAPIVIHGAWIREAPPGATALAAYLVIQNGSNRDDRLLKATCDVAAKTSIHQTTMDQGMMRMREVTGLLIPAHGRVVFKPGGNHVMLEGPKRPLRAGSRVPMTFTFQYAGTLRVVVPVEHRAE